MSRNLFRWLGRLGAAGLMLAVFFVSSRPMPALAGNIPGVDKLLHFAVYGLLAAFLLLGMKRERGDNYSTGQLLAAAAIASFYGASDELHQYFVPARSPEVLDWVADSVGALTGALLVVMRARLRLARAALRK